MIRNLLGSLYDTRILQYCIMRQLYDIFALNKRTQLILQGRLPFLELEDLKTALDMKEESVTEILTKAGLMSFGESCDRVFAAETWRNKCISFAGQIIATDIKRLVATLLFLFVVYVQLGQRGRPFANFLEEPSTKGAENLPLQALIEFCKVTETKFPLACRQLELGPKWADFVEQRVATHWMIDWLILIDSAIQSASDQFIF